MEGIEGSGKTTHVPALVACVENCGWQCTVTREPGGTIAGRAIRAILLDPRSRGLDPRAELLLYMADRAQHIAEVIRPALEAGKAVICDRYADATLAYQGYARGLDLALIRSLHEVALGGLTPDLTLLLDLPASIGLERAWSQIDGGQRDRQETRFEEERIDFHRKVRAGYLELARQAPDRFRVIDASGEIAVVCSAVCRAVEEVLTAKSRSAGRRGSGAGRRRVGG